MTSKISSRVSLANAFEILSILELSIKPSSCFCDMSVLPWSLEHEQDLAAAIRFQGLLERFLELVEGVHMLHCGGERSISYEVSQLLINLFDLFGRHSWELPTLKAVDDNRAARFKRFGQLAHGSSTHGIEDEAKFLPVESPLNILL